MPGKPLRLSLLVLLLGLPALAVDVHVPTEGKPGVGGGQAGAAGSVGGSAGSPLTTTLGLNVDLAGSIKPLPGAPALNIQSQQAMLAPAAASLPAGPSAAPAAAAAPGGAAPSYAEVRGALNPPAGYAGHFPNQPVFWPPNAQALLFEPQDKLNPKTYAGLVEAYKSHQASLLAGAAAHAANANGTQAALQKLASGQKTAAQTYEHNEQPQQTIPEDWNSEPAAQPAAQAKWKTPLGKPTFGKKGLAPQQGKPAVPVLAGVLATPNDAPGFMPAGMAGVGRLASPGDAPNPAVLEGAELTPFDAGKVAALQPPSPPLGDKVKGWVANAWGKLWGKPASTPAPASKPAAATTAPSAPRELLPESQAIVVSQQEPLENSAGLLVHAARAVRRDALGYRVGYLGLAAEEGAKPVADRGVRVRVERTGDAAETAALRERFNAFNRLIENNFAALELMARSSGKFNVKVARALFTYVEAMAKDYGQLVDQKESAEVWGHLAAIGVGFEEGVKAYGLGDADALPADLYDMVAPIEKQSVHHFINRIHQGALENIGNGGSAKPNLTVKLGAREAERTLMLTDISENPLVKDGRIVSPGFKALVGALLRSKDVPKGKLVMQDHQFQGHFQLGAHSAEVYANFLSPDEGGMLRVRYQEWGTGYDNQTRLYYVARLLQKTGFHVEQQNGFLTAVVDKDHAAQTPDQMMETFGLVVQALHATVGVDFALPMLVAGAQSSEEVGQRIDGWVDIVMGEGTLPFYVHDEQQQMIDGWQRYMLNAPRRARLREAMNERLHALGLPYIPPAEPFGQRSIDRYVTDAIEKALARGQLRLLGNGRLAKVPLYDDITPLAQSLENNELTASRMAEVVSSLDPALLDYETVGSLGGLTVERAQRRLDSDSWLTVNVLRDPKTGQIGFARAEIAVLTPGEGPKPLTPAGLFRELAQQGHPVAPFKPSDSPPGRSHFMRLLKEEPGSDPTDRARFLGLAASPAHGRPVVARVTYDKAKAAAGGHVFVAPYTSPDDLDAIKGSKAVLTTSGGLLSHAAITTREMGIPAAIYMGVEWQGGQAVLMSRSFGARTEVGGRIARRVRSVARMPLPEGAVVRLDPSTGQLEVFPPGSSAGLLDAANALEEYDGHRDGQKFAQWLLHRLRTGALNEEQKKTVASEALGGLAARALDRPEAASALALARAALLEAGQGGLANTLGARVFSQLGTKAAYSLAESRMLIARAQSIESVERLRLSAATLAARIGAVASALGRNKAEGLDAARLAAGVAADAEARSAKLLAEDVAELKAHAERYPSATMETLPLMKAAIAKARRRGLVPELVASWERQVRALESQREAALKAEKPLLMPLSSIIDADVAAVGGKGAKLGEIAAVVEAAGGRVAKGLGLTIHAYRAHLEDERIAKPIEAVMADLKSTPEDRAAQARKLILGGATAAIPGRNGGLGNVAHAQGPARVQQAIDRSLRFEGLDKTMLAVRSSAVDEDGAEAAFAGAGDTHLYVAPGEVWANVKEVWASLFNPRALLYRQTKGLSTANMAQAVVLQEMVPAEVAGVAFTQDPVTGDSSRLVVNAAFGLGEGVVSNRVSPDQYVVGKDLGAEILPPIIGDKKLAIVRAPEGKGTVDQKMPSEWRRRRSMTPEKLAKLNRVAVALERHFGYPLDIEFAFVGDELYILQARPVTVGGAQAAPTAAAFSAKRKNVLFVCTGNTCRSPMAEQLARTRLAREGRSDIVVGSRGLVVASEGSAMSDNALAVLAERGVDGSLHAAANLSAKDVEDATVLLAMTRSHKEQILDAFPKAKGKVFTLAEYAGRGVDVKDPYGSDLAAYRAAADAIEDALAVMPR